MSTTLTQDNAKGSMPIPYRYNADDTIENKVIYALSLIGEGTAEDVGIKISELDTSIEPGGFSHAAEPMLKQLCAKGIIHCKTGDDDVGYYFMIK